MLFHRFPKLVITFDYLLIRPCFYVFNSNVITLGLFHETFAKNLK